MKPPLRPAGNNPRGSEFTPPFQSLQPNYSAAKAQLTDLKTMNTNGGCIPEEILFDILTRLPKKSLCRFRCVSKLWFSIISDPDFVDAHLDRSSKLLISVQYLNPLQNGATCDFFSIDYSHQDSSAQPLRATSHSSIELNRISSISTSPSGLICFDCSNVIKIGNPITGDFGVIPYSASDPVRSYRSLFFGFDPIKKSPVILKLERRNYTIPVDPDFPDSAESGVFDLVENCWHDSREPHPWLAGAESDICINGVIYITANSGEFDVFLFAFDVKLKSFQLIPRPPGLHQALAGRFVDEHLIEYKSRVAFVGYGGSNASIVDEIKMWILEDTENHIWSFQSFVVPWRENLMRDGISIDSLESTNIYSERKVKLFGATHRGELILATSLSSGSPYLFFYEIETNMLRRFQVDGFGNIPSGSVRFSLVTESLLSPKDFKKKKKKKKESCPHYSCHFIAVIYFLLLFLFITITW